MLTRHSMTIGPLSLAGELSRVDRAPGVVLVGHIRGTYAHQRNQRVAGLLQRRGLSTLMFDLLTPDEAARRDAEPVDVDALTQRWLHAIDALPATDVLGLCGASAGAAAALLAAVQRPQRVAALVTRSALVELAAPALPDVRAATLLVVGSADTEVLKRNRAAYAQLHCVKRIELVPRATHLFLEAGVLEAATVSAAEWFATHLAPPAD